jgi:hypothetical protein
MLDPDDDASRHDYEVILRLLTPPPPADLGGEQPDPSQPEPGDSQPGEPGDSQPPPGDPLPGQDPGDSQPGDGTPQVAPGQGMSPQEIDSALDDIDREVSALIDGAGDNLTAQDALRILQLQAERARLSGLRDNSSGASDPSDY